MSLFRRPDSKFWFCWLEGAAKPRVNTGILVGTTRKQRARNRKQAEEVYHSLMVNRARERFGLPVEKPSRTFAEHRQWYAEHVTPTKRSHEREFSMLRQLAGFFDRYELAAITPALAREWRAQRLDDVSASTVTREEVILKHMLTTAVPTYLETNPLKGLKRLRVAPTDTRTLSHDEEKRLLAELRTSEDKALILLALDTLLRRTNAARLTRTQDHGKFLFSDSKAGAVKIPISTRLRKALDALKDTGTQYFPTYAAANANNLITRMFLEACERAKVQTGRKTGGVSFHCLRHTGATRMLAAGVDVKTVMMIGGWKNLTILSRYLHPTDEAALAAVNTIGKRRSGSR